MSRIKGTKSSAALIVSVVALVAALGGGAVAGVAVTSLNQKDKKQVKKISKKQAKKLDKKIELTPGPQGDTGPQGPIGPTVGTATPSVTATPEAKLHADDFQTTRAGRLLISTSMSKLGRVCDTDTTFSAWLLVDDVAVPGTQLIQLPENVGLSGLRFTGVTAESIAAGQHTAHIATACTDQGGGSTVASIDGGTSVVVLGD